MGFLLHRSSAMDCCGILTKTLKKAKILAGFLLKKKPLTIEK
jgi:hypothetical protein